MVGFESVIYTVFHNRNSSIDYLFKCFVLSDYEKNTGQLKYCIWANNAKLTN